MRKKLLIVGLVCLGIGYIANEIKPSRTYPVDTPRGQGLVHEHNYVSATFVLVGVTCLGICIFVDGKK